MFFLVNEENEHAMSLMLKLARDAKEGALIPCSKKELDSFNGGDFQAIQLNQEGSNLIEVDDCKSYLLFVNDDTTCLDDVMSAIKMLDLSVGIIRTADGTRVELTGSPQEHKAH